MVKFNFRIFSSCQRKHTTTAPEHPFPRCHRHKVIYGDRPCTTSPPVPSKQPPHPCRCRSNSGHQSAGGHFQTHISDNHLHNRTVKAYSHRFTTAYTGAQGGEDEKPPARSFSDVGVRSRLNGGGGVSPEWGSPARLSVFKKLMPCEVEGRVKESFAVVKRSEKPYEDFKKSMMEMIVENEIYEEDDLKQLLQCFLSLNSCYHHGVIIEAFLVIWNSIFLD